MKNSIDNLIGIALNLQIDLGNWVLKRGFINCSHPPPPGERKTCGFSGTKLMTNVTIHGHIQATQAHPSHGVHILVDAENGMLSRREVVVTTGNVTCHCVGIKHVPGIGENRDKTLCLEQGVTEAGREQIRDKIRTVPWTRMSGLSLEGGEDVDDEEERGSWRLGSKR